MHIIGKIDINIYKCVTEDIQTDEVIITDERINHIMERHPNDYEKYYSYMNEIISRHDFIIEANKPNTALILKSFNDEKSFKNSIITFMKINDKEWNRLLKNKKILCKSE